MAITIIFSILVCSISVCQSGFVAKVCGTNGNYANNSIYHKNLDSALANLSFAANTSNSGFYNVSVGQDLNRVNAIVLCRGDVQPDICRSCVKDSINKLREICPNQKEAVEWYDECMLRYSNTWILHNLATQPDWVNVNGYNASDMVQFNQDLTDLLDDLKGQAIQRKFATGNKSGDIYGLMQCTPDLSSTQCSDCLDESMKIISSRSVGVGCHIMKPSCRLRFEVARFYNQTTIFYALPPPRPNQLSPSPSLVPSVAGKDDTNMQKVIIIVAVIVGFVILLLLLVCIYNRKRKQRTATGEFQNDNMEDINSNESLQYDFGTVEVATNYFSDSNKLGQGGFGAVYKGTFQNGQEIAVKRLSLGSNQGQQEFRNEVILVAKLQHRNLVRLLGFCFEGTERLLIYEFVPNASLDHFIFDSVKRSYMDWKTRYKIICGVARGLIYLHEDSRLRIIHRDLKASNVLLDAEMNPKIADFGMARLFNLDETQGITSRIVGTYGYMAPEYAMYGQFSVKSDVFSFGVVILEILSGQKNHSFRNGENVEDLASFAWKNWREGTASNVIDHTLRNSSGLAREMIRCIHIGLLCVQENITDRPTMASVVLMLNSSSLTLAVPSEPAFFMQSTNVAELPLLPNNIGSKVNDKSIDCSVDKGSITDLYPR
ncbi:Cysteine-rich receptor-like protein kinase 29 [Heracleum sosnowskyi]|uniref:Cysteine-rich receptor-like protein kinase 29 n=1 Tax=Heracleum sosnowskyi TaxID=360622 RepID=A0AAD8MKA6_9APIA|nr:Cysteine-rich receptor-like protein kinase 29 [Heracleum sosnowskyi]